MDTDVKALLKDKRLWAGGAVAAAVGVVVFLKRSNSSTGGAGSAVGGSASGPGGSYVQGSADTTGTDIASYLGAYQQSNTALLNTWGQNLTDTLASLGGTPAQSGFNPDAYAQPSYNPSNPYGRTGVLGAGANLGDLSKLYWGDAKYADLLRLANLDAITKNNGNLQGLNLLVPVNPYYK